MQKFTLKSLVFLMSFYSCLALTSFRGHVKAYVPANDYFNIGLAKKSFEVTLINQDEIPLNLQLIDDRSGDVLSEVKLSGNSTETIKVKRSQYLKVVNKSHEDFSIGLELSKENVGIRYSDRYYND